MEKLKLFRYSGAKTQFVDKINYVLNKWEASTYVEAFLGSGAVFLNLDNEKYKKYYINDVDRNIIHVFNTFKQISYKYFRSHYEYIIKKFGDIEHSKEAFMNFRTWFNKNVWKSGTKSEGIFIMMLASSCINSFFRFGPNGFGSSWGNRNFAKNYDEYTHYHVKRKLNSNVSITNMDFFDFTEFLKEEEKGNSDITMFVDPPYVRGGFVDYMKTFGMTEYEKFIQYIKQTPYNVAYTDVWSKDLDWDYVLLRETMVNTGPSTDKFENGNKEVIFYNK
jgi:site-specific DNA-adenine methylase